MASDQQKEYLEAQMIQGQAFEEMIRTKGWEYIKAYYQQSLADFINSIMVQGRPITEFEDARNQLIGLKSLLGYIDGSIQTLNKEAKKEKNEKTT